MDLAWVDSGDSATEEEKTEGEEMQSDPQSASSKASDEQDEDVREQRTRHPPSWMKNYVQGEDLSEEEANMAFIVSSDPVNFEEAVKHPKWRPAMDAEIQSIEKNHTWQLVELPEGAN